MLYFADGRWWKWHDQGVARSALGLNAEQVQARFREFAGQKVSIQGNENFEIKDQDVLILRNADNFDAGRPLCAEQNGLATGRNSGYQAINLAWLTGAARIVLVGYDMQGKTERMHWFGDHPLKTCPGTVAMFHQGYNNLAKHLPPGLEIINCSAETALRCFPRGDLASVLPDPTPAALSA